MVLVWFFQGGLGWAAESGDDSAPRYFGIQVIDDQTGRGIPLVELRTVHEAAYWTDSAGWVAIGDPELMDREVYFHVRSHGYTLPPDGFGFQGVRLWVRPGKKATIRMQRQNIAERMYRITGAGIYRDSLLLGEPAPGQTPLVRADVAGQDSVQAAVYQGKVYWFWGDTNRLVYPLGNFRTTGAVSPLPGQAGFDPNITVPIQYFTGPDGRCKNLCPFEPKEGMIWIDGLVVVRDAKQGEKLVAHYARMKSLAEMLEHGLALWDDQNQQFRLWVRFPKETMEWTLLGHPFQYRQKADSGPGPYPSQPKAEKPASSAPAEGEYIYCGLAFPNVRVPAKLEAMTDPGQYETWTCLAEGSRLPDPKDGAETSPADRNHREETRRNHREETSPPDPREAEKIGPGDGKAPLPQAGGKNRPGTQNSLPTVKRGPDGKPIWRWSRDALPISPALEHRLVKAGLLQLEETHFLPVDVHSGRPVEIHSGSVRWNPWRKRWIMIGVEQGGSSSFLGEVWYAEALSPVGPWRRTVKIVTHDRYSFYNPVHHDFLDQEGGRIIFFEGTYSHTFSGNPLPTPRYDYNQIMYRLDLAAPQLRLVHQ